jgi:hypothetical protein
MELVEYRNRGELAVQVEDMECKTWVVRTDVGNKPSWLKLNVMKDRTQKFDTTDDERIAHQFNDHEEAENVAADWSDVPGVWYVERVGM